MNIGIPNLSGTQADQGVVQYNSAPNVQTKASALTGEVLEVTTVQPSTPVTSTQSGVVASLREAAAQEPNVRPEMIEKGSAFLADPNYPPLDSVNGIASIFIDDFFLKELDSGSK